MIKVLPALPAPLSEACESRRVTSQKGILSALTRLAQARPWRRLVLVSNLPRDPAKYLFWGNQWDFQLCKRQKQQAWPFLAKTFKISQGFLFLLQIASKGLVLTQYGMYSTPEIQHPQKLTQNNLKPNDTYSLITLLP